jgi:hypothetical protein
MERLIYANENAREAKVTVWIFEGSSLYVLIASAALALASFRFAYDQLRLATWASAGVGGVPLVLASVYVLTLKLGKPKSYDVDVFRSLVMRVIRSIARSGLMLVKLELHGLSPRKSRHPYAAE